MARPPFVATQGGLPRPGPFVKGLLLTLFGVWLSFALAINWADVSPRTFTLFCGNTEQLLSGEVWRLFTAPLLHLPQGSIGHILGAMIGLYFFGTALEEAWGGRRLLAFLTWSSLFAYGLQVVVSVILPADLVAKLVGDYWFGAIPAVEAAAIAWALNFKQGTVRLWFVVPVSSRGLIIFIVAISVMWLVAGAMPQSGHIALFAGMLAGWLFGGGTPSPMRKLYLKFRLYQLDQEAKKSGRNGRERARRAGLRVVEGGAKKPGNHNLH